MMQRKNLVFAFLTLTILVASVFFGVLGSIGHTRASSAVTTARDFSIPTGSDPWGTAFDSSGNVWVAIPSCDPSPMCNGIYPGTIAVFTPSSSSWTHIYNLPTGYGQPLFLAFDQQGQLWFAMPMSNSIGMLNPTSGIFQQWNVPTANAGPWDIAVDGNGNIWFTEHYSNKIGMFNPSSQQFSEIQTPASNSNPYGIVIDSSNNVWFTENTDTVALIGEYTAQGQLEEYKIRNSSTTGLTPHLITIDPNGNIWWSEGWARMIGELHVSLAQPGTNNGVTEYAYPSICSGCSSHTSGISVDSNGNIWFDDALENAYGSFPDTGTGSFSMYSAPTANGHPHDGMHVDANNTVWFDEEFANKLAAATSNIPPMPTPSPSPSPTQPSNGYNNVGTSNDNSPSTAAFDGGRSYSAQALQAAGVIPGQTVLYNHVSFTWPNVQPGTADNYLANGQTIPITPISNASVLAFLGASSFGPSTGTATITYTDGSTQTFFLDFSDWTLNGGNASPSNDNQIAITMSYRNNSDGSAQIINTYVFYTDVILQAGKTVQSVTLPSQVDTGQLHVFAIGTN